MAQEFRLPDIGEGLTEAEIVRWLVEVGDHVDADQPVVEVETDKAVVEIPSPYAGTVLQHGGAPGDVIEVGEILVVVGDAEPAVAESQSGDFQMPKQETTYQGPPVEEPPYEGSPAQETAFQSPQPQESSYQGASTQERNYEPPTPAVESQSVAPIVGTLSEEAEVLSPRSAQGSTTSSNVKALPVVRKLARDSGIDISDLNGSGPEGRITRDDVLAAIAAAAPEPEPEPTPTSTSETYETPAGSGEVGRQKMSRLRRTIAANMSRSWAEIPHVTTFDDVDATRLLETRTALAKRHERKIPIEALVVKAVLPALAAYPEFNSTIDGEDLVIHGSRDIGIAVDTQDGLLVAVIRDAANKSVLDLAAEVERLGEGAKDRSLALAELSGQTFTVSNIGAVGGGHGTPIVPYGTTAILSVGRARDRVIVADGDLVVAPVMPLSLSYDHRVIDGRVGRRFMALLMENLEEPALFLAG